MESADLSGLARSDYAALRDLLTGPVAKLAAARRAIRGIDSLFSEVSSLARTDSLECCREAVIKAQRMLLNVQLALMNSEEDE